MDSLFRFENVSVHLQRQGRSVAVVDEMSFALAESEVVALVGESGCGKTTTALAALRLLPTGMILRGTVWLAGRELTRLSEAEMQGVRGKDLAMILQDPAAALNPVFTIGEQIAEGMRWHERVSRRTAWNRAVALLAEVGLPDPAIWARSYPHQVSGGMKQRALIASAIACGPKVLIADEPTASLDLTLREQIISLLNRLRVERRLGLLVISHDLHAVAGLADRVAVMFAGQIIELVDVHTFFNGPKHPYSQALFGAAVRLADCVAEGSGGLSARPISGAGCRYAAACPHVADECSRSQELVELRPGHSVRCWRASEVKE